MSGNPFRRAQQPPPDLQLDHSLRPRTPPQNRSKSKKKKVVIQTPPHSPDEPAHDPPRRLSDGRTGSPPPPVTQVQPGDDDTDSVATADDELEAADANARRNSGPLQPPTTSFHTQSGSRAPYNPFARTLATSEAAFGKQDPTPPRGGAYEANGLGDNVVAAGPGRPALDVDAFKNILMTGTATPPLSLVQDNRGTSAAASGSRASAFDSFRLPESPRHSFDDTYSDDSEEDDNEHSSLMGPVESRPQEIAPPAPPKPGQYPQTVSFANFEGSMASPITRPTVTRKASDLNKPLPAPPPASAPTITEDLQGLTMTPSKDEALQKKAPPPPPATRRQGQSSSTHGRARSSSNLTQGSTNEDTSVLTPTLSNKIPAPRPPPSRRAQPPPPTTFSLQEPSPEPSQTDGSSTTMPPPPPRRNPSKASGSLGRTSSTSSRNSLQRNPDPLGTNTGGSAPPIPPPRRGPGASKRVSTEYRSSSGQSGDSDPSLTSLTPTTSNNNAATFQQQQSPPPQRDFMSDLAAFQAEVEALRAKNVS